MNYGSDSTRLGDPASVRPAGGQRLTAVEPSDSVRDFNIIDKQLTFFIQFFIQLK